MFYSSTNAFDEGMGLDWLENTMVLYSTPRFQGEVSFAKGALDPVGKSGMDIDINIWDSGHSLSDSFLLYSHVNSYLCSCPVNE